MNIDYKITKYFQDNDLFDNEKFNGLTVKMNSKSLLITGTSKDLVEFADLLVNIAKSKENAHIHIDDLALLNKNSDFSEIVVEKSNN